MSIKWRENWEIGIEQIDNQHKALVDQVANLIFTIQLNKKIVNWLIAHIGRVDQKYDTF